MIFLEFSYSKRDDFSIDLHFFQCRISIETKKMDSSGEALDRLSSLPNVRLIISSLSFKECVSTSAISRRWRNIYREKWLGQVCMKLLINKKKCLWNSLGYEQNIFITGQWTWFYKFICYLHTTPSSFHLCSCWYVERCQLLQIVFCFCFCFLQQLLQIVYWII